MDTSVVVSLAAGKTSCKCNHLSLTPPILPSAKISTPSSRCARRPVRSQPAQTGKRKESERAPFVLYFYFSQESIALVLCHRAMVDPSNEEKTKTTHVTSPPCTPLNRCFFPFFPFGSLPRQLALNGRASSISSALRFHILLPLFSFPPFSTLSSLSSLFFPSTLLPLIFIHSLISP